MTGVFHNGTFRCFCSSSYEQEYIGFFSDFCPREECKAMVTNRAVVSGAASLIESGRKIDEVPRAEKERMWEKAKSG